MTRRMDTKSRFLLSLMKLLRRRMGIGPFGSLEYTLKNGGKVYVRPHWITESN